MKKIKCEICSYHFYGERRRKCCSKECSNQLRKQTNIIKYGVESPLKSEEIKNKVRQTCFKKYGNFAFHLVESLNKKREIFLEKYGVETPFQSAEVRNKIKQTNITKYGVDCPLQSNEIQKKIRQTNLERYGGNSPMCSQKVKDKIKQTNLKRFGVDNPFQSEEIKDKIKQTNLKKYQKEFPSHTAKGKITNLEKYGVNHIKQLHIPKEFLTSEWWNERKDFLEAKDLIADHLSCSSIYKYAHQFRPDWNFDCYLSQPHKKILNLLNEYQISYEVNDRQLIKPLELDIFIPSKSLAIEVNGVYWHSELAGGKDRNYHLNKTVACEKQGIQLFQFLDIEIENQWDIVLSILSNKLGINRNKIGARKCKVIEIPILMEKYFLKENHLQGHVSSSMCLGLEYQNELVSLMSFRKPRFNKNVDWELLRFCNLQNTQVTGGASKLFSKRPKGTIISYADRRYSTGNLYNQLGFIQQDLSTPNYFYTKDYQTLESRMKYQKHKLPNVLENFDPSLTEWENMQANGFDRIWDCGNLSFIKGGE